MYDPRRSLPTRLTTELHEVFPCLSTHLIAATTFLAVATHALAQPVAHRTATATIGTIIIAHGGDSAWNARVHDVARQTTTGGPVEVSFLMGPEAKTARFQDAVARLEAKGSTAIVVVPVLVSKGTVSRDKVPKDIEGTRSVYAGEPLLPHAAMAAWVESRVRGVEAPR